MVSQPAILDLCVRHARPSPQPGPTTFQEFSDRTMRILLLSRHQRATSRGNGCQSFVCLHSFERYCSRSSYTCLARDSIT